MMMYEQTEEEKRQMRKRKNRESAEKNRQVKNDSIETLQADVTRLSSDIHRVMVDNWYIRQSATGSVFCEPFPSFTPPILEPAVF
jgi:hypothetical protein